MSDVGVAPAPSAPAAPPPAAPSEVAINPNPVHSPAPVGAQAPNKPVENLKGSEHRPESRREAIERAFKRAEQAEPAKPRMGHNNPPEEMQRERKAEPAKEKEKLEPINLRQRPEQPRDRGRFASNQEPGEGAKPQQQGAGQQQQRPAAQLPEGAPYREAPQRMSERAKAEWGNAPESVRAEVHRMHQDFGRAYQQYRGDHEEMNSIRQFAQMAREHGTTLQRALSNYTGMEHKLRNDVVGGLDVIVNNLNLRAADGQKLTLRDVAWHIVNQTPEQQQLLQSQNTQMAQSHQLQAAHQRIAALENHARAMQHQAVFTHTRGAVDQFAEEHPRLDELGDLIEQEVKLGFDLPTAYRRAELLRPATQAAQTRTTTNGTQAAQTRNPDRSIHGSPGGSTNGARQRPKEPVGRRDAIASAIRRVNGTL